VQNLASILNPSHLLSRPYFETEQHILNLNKLVKANDWPVSFPDLIQTSPFSSEKKCRLGLPLKWAESDELL